MIEVEVDGLRLDFLVSATGDRVETSGVDLGGILCKVLAQFRRWDRAWMISVWLPSGQPVVLGATANDGEDMLGNVVVPGRPPGQLLVVDTLGKFRNPDLGDWRAGVWLVYVPTPAVASAT